MSATPLSRELYDRIVEAFRECPGNFSAAARKVGVDRRMTTRAWRAGWKKYEWARPIKDVLREEQEAALAHRLRLRKEAEAEADQMREDAKAASIQARSEEMRMVEGARKGVIGTLVVALDLLPAMRVLAKEVSEFIRGGNLQQTTAGMRAAMELMDRHAKMMDKATRAADVIVKLSRLDRGVPTAHVGMTGGPVLGAGGAPGLSDEELTHERAVELVEMSADILDQVRKSGSLPADVEMALSGDAAPPN